MDMAQGGPQQKYNWSDMGPAPINGRKEIGNWGYN